MINEGILLRKLKADFPNVSFKTVFKDKDRHVEVNNSASIPLVISEEIKKLGTDEREIFSIFYESIKKDVKSILDGKKLEVKKVVDTVKTVIEDEKKALFNKKKK